MLILPPHPHRRRPSPCNRRLRCSAYLRRRNPLESETRDPTRRRRRHTQLHEDLRRFRGPFRAFGRQTQFFADRFRTTLDAGCSPRTPQPVTNAFYAPRGRLAAHRETEKGGPASSSVASAPPRSAGVTSHLTAFVLLFRPVHSPPTDQPGRRWQNRASRSPPAPKHRLQPPRLPPHPDSRPPS